MALAASKSYLHKEGAKASFQQLRKRGGERYLVAIFQASGHNSCLQRDLCQQKFEYKLN